jgi:hypothetical protein
LAFIALGPNATFGVIATPAFGVSLSGGLSSQALRLGVTASYFPQRRANSAEQPVLAAVMDLRTLALWACWMNRLSGALRGGACGVTELGAIGARGEGATRVHSQTKLWGATGLGGVLLLGLGRDFDFGLEAAAMLPWGRPEFVVAGARIHEPSPAVGGVRALLEARFR